MEDEGMGETRANWVLVSDAAVELGISGARVRELLASGQLHGEKFNSRLWLIYRRELNRFKKLERPHGVHVRYRD
jgi:hypothetical protein